jgi:hypothetical protein
MLVLFASAVRHGIANSMMPLEHPSKVKSSLAKKLRVFAADTILAVM